MVVDQDSTKAQPNDKPNDKIKRNIARCGVVIETLGPALAMVASPSGGAQLLYKGTGREGNAKWAYGDIRSQKGHVVMYDPVATLEAAQRVERDATLEPVDVSLLPTESGEENKPKSASKPRPTPGELARISDMAVVPYRQDQAPRLDFWGSDIRNHTTEGDTLWVNYTTSHFSSRSTVS